MAQRKPFLLRLDPATHEALQHWADADLRSLNAQIEFLLRRALREAGRLPEPGQGPEAKQRDDASGEAS
ncbi:MAG: hypothetical protein ACRD8O_17580 [Bryobacteraceae bacterium]